ncbi:MAG: zinc-finger domain-containing protein [Methylovirgula sp.]
MANHGTPHFHNQPGVARVRIGAKEFMCTGALPPFDHPHVFIDMGDASDAICPYCSTHYVHDASLAPGACEPPECAFPIEKAAAA